MNELEHRFRSKEVSWLSFNSRVLQEAANPEVPHMERLKFLGIYSSNLDEFFRVRVATLKRLSGLGSYYLKLGIPNPVETLQEVNDILSRETTVFNRAYVSCMKELRKNKIQVVDETQVPKALQGYLKEYFEMKVRPHLMPIMVKTSFHPQGLKDQPMYLAVRMLKKKRQGRAAHALLEIPTNVLDRFLVLPKLGERSLVMYLDDIIRFGLPDLFKSLPYDSFESYAVKFTRDAEMEIDDDFTESFFEKVSDALDAREEGNPVRLNYDRTIPEDFLKLLLKKLQMTSDDTLFPGARHHNRKDLMKFPKLGGPELYEPKIKPIPHPRVRHSGNVGFFRIIRSNDILLHFPYHSFNNFLDLLREAILDPFVQSIKLTQYRFAKRSAVALALISGVRAGKKVTILVEPTARFDEEANIEWADEYRKAGIRVILGVPGLKVHTKLCLITRNEGGKKRRYSCVGTGNFNEDTANLYTDHMLITSNPDVGRDVNQVFRFFERSYRPPSLHTLVCSPFDMRDKLTALIKTEIKNAKAGKPSGMTIKINNLSDPEIVDQLYRASEAGVKIRLIVRSMFSVIPGQEGFSDNIEGISIVDKFLEHTRILKFVNGGEPRYFMTSGDMLPRNLDSRVEILFPIDNKEIQKELETYLDIQWQDGVKARRLDAQLSNELHQPKGKAVRSQIAIEEYLRKLARQR